MSSVFKKTGISEQEQREISSIVFVKLAEKGELNDSAVMRHSSLFTEWSEKWTGAAGSIVKDSGNLYKSIHNVTNTAQNTKPSTTPSMWMQIGNPNDEYPAWYAPIGAHDAYSMGAKVTYEGKHYKSTENNNVWRPGVFGWKEQ